MKKSFLTLLFIPFIFAFSSCVPSVDTEYYYGDSWECRCQNATISGLEDGLNGNGGTITITMNTSVSSVDIYVANPEIHIVKCTVVDENEKESLKAFPYQDLESSGDLKSNVCTGGNNFKVGSGTTTLRPSCPETYTGMDICVTTFLSAKGTRTLTLSDIHFYDEDGNLLY